MIIRNSSLSKNIPSSEITPEKHYLNRRKFLAFAGSSSLSLLVACSPQIDSTSTAPGPILSGDVDDLGLPLTSYDDVTGYNNYYEFSIDKNAVARLSSDFVTSPWQITVGGLVHNPGVYDISTLVTNYGIENRIYRMRCVEAWSMVIPWNGFPLSRLLSAAEPMTSARFVRFETLLDPSQMPGQQDNYYPWPYVEGLRLDEAMNDLTILSTGLYDQPLLPQNGAPIRLVVPWKYGFKSIKSIVRIDLVEEIPQSFWMRLASNEYGFYANVNPQVSHPRWSQSSERRIGESGRRETLMFNGYSEQVGQLYSNMDLSIDY